MGYTIKKDLAARPLLFLMLDSADHVTPKTGLSPTVTISKNGAAFASPAGAVTELANGWYKVAGNATDSNTAGPLLLHAAATGADPVDDVYQVEAITLTDAAIETTAQNAATAAGNAASDILTVSAAVSAMSGATFDTSTDSLEAIRNRGDAAWTGSSAEAVADAVLDEVLSGHAAAGTAGKALADAAADAAAVKALVVSGGAGDVEAILSVLAGVAAVDNSNPAAPVVTFKKADGTTTKVVITYSSTDGTRTASVRS